MAPFPIRHWLSQRHVQTGDFGIGVLGKSRISELQPREMILGPRPFTGLFGTILSLGTVPGTKPQINFPLLQTPIIDRHSHASCRGRRQQMRVNMWGNEGTAEGGGLGTSGLHPQCCQNPHKHLSSRTEVLAAFHLAARGDSGWWFRQTVPASFALGFIATGRELN